VRSSRAILAASSEDRTPPACLFALHEHFRRPTRGTRGRVRSSCDAVLAFELIAREERANLLEDFFLFGKTSFVGLRKNLRAVDADVEDSAAEADDLRVEPELSFNLGRQTGGPWEVVSNSAVFDEDMHLSYLSGRSYQNRCDVVMTAALVRKIDQASAGFLEILVLDYDSKHLIFGNHTRKTV